MLSAGHEDKTFSRGPFQVISDSVTLWVVPEVTAWDNERHWIVSHLFRFSYSWVNKIDFISTLNVKLVNKFFWISSSVHEKTLLELLSFNTWILVSVRNYKWVKLFSYLGLKHNIHIRPIEKNKQTKNLLIKLFVLNTAAHLC